MLICLFLPPYFSRCLLGYILVISLRIISKAFRYLPMYWVTYLYFFFLLSCPFPGVRVMSMGCRFVSSLGVQVAPIRLLLSISLRRHEATSFLYPLFCVFCRVPVGPAPYLPFPYSAIFPSLGARMSLMGYVPSLLEKSENLVN